MSADQLNLVSLLLTFAGLFVLYRFEIEAASIILAALLVLTSAYLVFVWAKTPQDRLEIDIWLKYAIIGFFAGAVFDILLNIYSRVFTGINALTMKHYFNEVGTLQSLLFSGLITSIMVLNSAALVTLFGFQREFWSLAIFGFGVGILWGTILETLQAKAAMKLMVFYKNTPGGVVENRAWDGLSILIAAVMTRKIVTL